MVLKGSLASHRENSRVWIGGVLFSTGLLACEGEQQQHGQVPQAAEKQLARTVAVSFAVEAERQEADVQVYGERDDGKSPSGDI